jgi:phage-related protein
MKQKFARNILYYREYYLVFFEKQNVNVQKKLNWTLQLVASLDQLPKQYFKHIEGTRGLYEIRAEVGSDIFRIFCFFDEGRLIILLNAFQKKTQKTPRKEIELAEKLRTYYYNEKDKH